MYSVAHTLTHDHVGNSIGHSYVSLACRSRYTNIHSQFSTDAFIQSYVACSWYLNPRYCLLHVKQTLLPSNMDMYVQFSCYGYATHKYTVSNKSRVITLPSVCVPTTSNAYNTLKCVVRAGTRSCNVVWSVFNQYHGQYIAHRESRLRTKYPCFIYPHILISYSTSGHHQDVRNNPCMLTTHLMGT